MVYRSCLDCAHLVERDLRWLCDHPAHVATTLDPIAGRRVRRPECNWMRAPGGPCGPAARLYRPRDELPFWAVLVLLLALLGLAVAGALLAE